MDGLDTLSQVALADQVNIAQLCFDIDNTQGVGGGRLPSMSVDDNLNTPVTSNQDVTFFGCGDPWESVPITATGRLFMLILFHSWFRARFDFENANIFCPFFYLYRFIM